MTNVTDIFIFSSKRLDDKVQAEVFLSLIKESKISLDDIKRNKYCVLTEILRTDDICFFKALLEYRDDENNGITLDDLRNNNRNEILRYSASSNLKLLKYLLSFKDQYGNGLTVEDKDSVDYECLQFCYEVADDDVYEYLVNTFGTDFF